MRLHRFLPVALIAFAGLSLGSGCPTMPKLEDRIVELAISSSTTLDFVGQSTVSTSITDGGSVDFSTDFDIKGLLNDAGIDISQVTGIALSGVSYRVSVADANGRSITSGTVSIQRQGGPVVPLVTAFAQSVASTTPFATAPLSSQGVAVLNTMLNDLLTSEKNGTTLVNPAMSFTFGGTADGLPYSFGWQLKLDVSIKGHIQQITIPT